MQLAILNISHYYVVSMQNMLLYMPYSPRARVITITYRTANMRANKIKRTYISNWRDNKRHSAIKVNFTYKGTK